MCTVASPSRRPAAAVRSGHGRCATTQPAAAAIHPEVVRDAKGEAYAAKGSSQLGELLAPPRFDVVERWVGHYPVGHDDYVLVVRAGDAVRVVVVTSGTGASTGFAIGEEVCAGS